ncbi:MAG: glycine cleavage system protein GcvH [Candidatus Aadella gelida]|nr:glycine cleavage system protein GcvH [Candidatus Aadella gelida]
MVPEDLKYTKEHEWVKVEGTKATIGITDHAQSELGDITFIELPEIGSEINVSDSIATVESVKAASDIYAPLAGKVTEVNEALESSPEVVNQSPYDEGWILKVEVSGDSGKENLMDQAAYETYIKENK